MDDELVLHYWACKARTYATAALASHAQIRLTLKTDINMEVLKSLCPFGQIPLLTHGEIKIAQSNAILRYIGSLAGTNGSTLAQLAISEMLIEGAGEIYSMIHSTNALPNKREVYMTHFLSGGRIDALLGFHEKILADLDAVGAAEFRSFFNKSADRLTGEFALCAVLDILVNLCPNILDPFPALRLFYDDCFAIAAFDAVRDWEMYYAL